MSALTTTKPKRKLSTFELSAPARAALERIAADRKWSKTTSVEQALLHYASETVAAFPAILENSRRLSPLTKGGRK